ncbi:hypothetical protein [Actinoallomurus soli]|uniref:hypothetical protein n=1 Tax=Actinoallomurus soli TaxID=2952535 RepID=UPI002093AB34|nr:hypothetical protein [Actinoallomurus soli]MCO5967917.1 hypothetical protein [Actinoallomurus soli]
MTKQDVPTDGQALESPPRNSVALGVFLGVASHPRVPFTVVELAGRGITADAAATRWMLEVGKPSLDGLTLANKVIEFGEWEERLIDLWRAFRSGDVETALFETRLAEIVTAMEEWPSDPDGRG